MAVGALAIDPDLFTPFWGAGAPADGVGGRAALPGATLLVLYAYVGFENLVVPAGDMEAPERVLPRGIVAVLATVTILYVAAQLVVTGILGPAAGAAGTEAVARAAGARPGTRRRPGGGGGDRDLDPRGQRRELADPPPALLGPRRAGRPAGGPGPALTRASARRRRRWSASTSWSPLVALSGSFAQLAVLAVVGRLIQYIPTCLAVLVLRRRDGASAFRLPGGPAIPGLALILCIALLLQASALQLLAGAVAALVGLAVYALRRRSPGPEVDPLGESR